MTPSYLGEQNQEDHNQFKDPERIVKSKKKL